MPNLSRYRKYLGGLAIGGGVDFWEVGLHLCFCLTASIAGFFIFTCGILGNFLDM